MLGQCWASGVDGGPTLTQHWNNVSCFIGCHLVIGNVIVGELVCVAESKSLLYVRPNTHVDVADVDHAAHACRGIGRPHCLLSES